MPCNMNLPKAGVVSTRATDFSSLDPFRKLLLCCVFLLVLIVLVNSSAWAQQNVFSRSEVSTGNWWDNANPWYYQVWNNSQNRPDNNSGTRNYLKIGHNNNLTMTTNGAFFSLSSLDFESGASSARTINGGGAGTGISLSGGIYNTSSATHIINADIGIDGTTVQLYNNSTGGMNFGGTIYINSNTAEFGGSGTGNHTVSGIMTGTGGKLSKVGNSTLTLTGQNSYTGSTTITSGTLILARGSGATLPSGNAMIINSGGTLKVSSNQTLSSISLNSGGTLIVDAGVTLSLTTFSQNGTVTNNGTILVNGTPLPITFTSLTGNIRNGQAQLNWTIADEHNVDHYQVEESVNGRQFQSFIQVDAASRSSYQTIDAQLHTGANYYRVKAVDIDGKLTYSKIIRLENSAIDQQIRVYPNPSQGELTLGLNIAAGNYQIRVINAVGQIVFQQPLTHEGGSRSMPLGLPKLNAGIYQVEVRGGVQKYVRSIRID